MEKRYWIIAPYKSEKKDIFDCAWKFDLENNTIAIGYDIGMDLSGLKQDELRKKMKKEWTGYTEYQYKCYFRVLWSFWHEIKNGDIVIARRGVKKIIGIGEVEKTAFYDVELGKRRVHLDTDEYYPSFLNVKWDQNFKEIDFGKTVFGMTTLVEIDQQKYDLLIKKDIDKIEITDEEKGSQIDCAWEMIKDKNIEIKLYKVKFDLIDYK